MLSLSFLSPSHPSFITAHSHQSRFLSMTDGLCERSSKSTVRSSARVVKAERRAVHSGTCVALWDGDWGSQKRFWVGRGVLSVILASLSTPGSHCGRPGSDHVVHGKAAARALLLSKEKGGFFFQGLPLFLLSPHQFPRALFQQSLWFFSKPTASQASLQVTLFQHLNHNPLQPFSPHFVLPSVFLPVSLSLCVSTMVRSHGGRQLAGCRLAAMATGTLPLPQVSLATSSLAL